MKKTLCILLALCLSLSSCTLALGEAATASLDYSLAEKLQKQLEIGSGFAGTLTFSLTAQEGRESEAITTLHPFEFECTYISVLADALNGVVPEERYEVVFMDEENPRALASLSLMGGEAYVKSSLLGSGDWYILPKGLLGLSAEQDEESAEAMPTAADGGTDGASEALEGDANSAPAAAATGLLIDNPISSALQGFIDASAMPALLRFALPALFQASGRSTSDLSEALSTYTTKIDLWIEGYRQNAVLDKLEDGTTTMEAQYTIPPAAIKAQLKEMVMDVLADAPLLAKLQALLPEEQAQMLLNPQLLSFYFYAIDELLLAGDLKISRTVSLKGDTLALHLELPLYDQDAGDVILSYDRKAGEGQDLPDENIISIQSQNVVLQAEYQEYKTMTGVTVYQGTIRREPKGIQGFSVGEDTDDMTSKIFAAAFTLSHEQLSETNEENYETLAHDLKLTLEPYLITKDESGVETILSEEAQSAYYQFPAFDLALNLLFKSKPEKNASTSIDIALSLSGEELPQQLDLTFSGKSKAKWTPDPVGKTAQRLLDLSQGELTTLLAETAVKTGVCFLPFMRLPRPVKTPAPSTDAQATPETGEAVTP